MKRTIFACDLCKKEIPNGSKVLNVITKPNGYDVNEYDVCEECMESLELALKGLASIKLLPYPTQIQC